MPFLSMALWHQVPPQHLGFRVRIVPGLFCKEQALPVELLGIGKEPIAAAPVPQMQIAAIPYQEQAGIT